MKKILSTLIVCIICVTLGACSSTQSNSNEDKRLTETTSVEKKEIELNMIIYGDDSHTTEEFSTKGEYSGEVKNGIPNGEGKFVYKNIDGDERTYKGTFKDGTFNGKGKTYDENGDTLTAGTFSNGQYTPTKSELINLIITYYDEHEVITSGSIADTTLNFIDQHSDYFPIKTENVPEDYNSYIKQDAVYSEITKKSDEYMESIVGFNYLTVTQIYETFLYGENTVTEIYAYDQDMKCYVIYYFDSTDLHEGDIISHIEGIPFLYTSYPNTGGGYTLAMFLLATQYS